MSAVDDVLAIVADETELDAWYLRGRSRTGPVSAARAAAARVLSEDRSLSLAEIGREFSRDRATIRHLLRVAESGPAREIYDRIRLRRPRGCSDPTPTGSISCAA